MEYFNIVFILVIFTIMTSTNGLNLTSIKWDHAVNSQSKLDAALQSNIDFIEADVILGHLNNETAGDKIPVMGHPPEILSDISLASFFEQVMKHNLANVNKTLGVKLDFKSIEVFNGSISMLSSYWGRINYPVWLNADIYSGPVENNYTTPVNPESFFAGAKLFSSAVLSIGWTTNWGPAFQFGEYTTSQIDTMINSIKVNGIAESRNVLTFPVRAGIAAHSHQQLKRLLSSINSTNECTLTIWSSANDSVDIGKLQSLILNIGVDRVYLDVPEEVSNKLNLGSSASVLGTSVGLSTMLLTCFIFLKSMF